LEHIWLGLFAEQWKDRDYPTSFYIHPDTNLHLSIDATQEQSQSRRMTAGINDNTKFRSTIRISINSRPLFDSNAYLLKLQKYIMHKNYRTSTIFLSNNYGTHNIIEKKYITYTNSFFVFKTHADATLLCNPSNRGITYYFSHRVTTYIGVND